MRFSYDLDRALSRRGLAITVATSDQVDLRYRTDKADEEIDGITMRRYPNPSNYLAGRLQWLSYRPVGLRRAVIDLAAACDVVHVTEARGPHVRWAFAAARAAGVPVVWSPLGGLAEGVGIRKPYRRLYDRVYRTRRLIGEARAIVAQSVHEAAVLARLGAQPHQVRPIELGVDASRFRALPARGAFRRAAGFGERQPLVLFMGRFHPTKGLDVLMEAAAIARRALPDLAVALVGWDHGALRTVRRRARALRLEEAVRILPPLFGDFAVQAYVDADVFAVAATLYEETSLAALEALAAGTPCVLTRQCEVRGLQDMGGGQVTDCAPEAFATGLLTVLEDPHRVARARSARRTILGSRTIEHSAEEYAAVFRGIAGVDAERPHHLAL
ncbi:MAG: hypothetical protein A3F70_03610 [Acidobacteria bacterium RIFCSPLOWO2_12_FULL_67_14]|nr:MAG: hypothetical protein A3H29_15840 [Acidobacteria bacterium RIFCSPLOWO2_02_FULL_67_21]OFW40084.1 MAG: hypothetical protein A3F70_03610 [Acidobacteria bacterium RIFCSPLOWO2_12_FULL_67_14]